jgi:hypothetical protein
MAEITTVNFTSTAAEKIVKATKIVLGETTDQTGQTGHKRSYNYTDFWAKVTSYSAYPYHYAWTEQYDSGSNTLANKPSGLSGTTTTNYAVNGWEQTTAGAHSPPLPSGTIVLIRRSFDSSGNVVWRFNQLPPPMFPVKVTNDGGVAGSMASGTSCTLTYTVKDITGTTTLATTQTPDAKRYTSCAYNICGANSPGLAYLDSAGAIHLYSVAQETPVGSIVTNITDIQVVDASQLIQIKTQNQLVLDSASKSAFTTIYTGSTCP